jgi:hypothetical protein
MTYECSSFILLLIIKIYHIYNCPDVPSTHAQNCVNSVPKATNKQNIKIETLLHVELHEKVNTK